MSHPFNPFEEKCVKSLIEAIVLDWFLVRKDEKDDSS